MSYTNLLAIWCFLLTFSNAEKLTTISSPQFCLDDSECPSSKFCDTRDESFDTDQTFMCQPLPVAGADCGFIGCAPGLFCDIFQVVGSEDNVCQQQLPENATCANEFGLSFVGCQPPNLCSPNTSTCQPPLDDGEPCSETSLCGQDSICSDGTCQPLPLLPDFADCETGTCEGVCTSDGIRSICVPSAGLGGACFSDVPEGCAQSENGEELICNAIESQSGQCVERSSLITTLGAKCNPSLDSCDRRRSLSCRFSSSLGTSVCQHFDRPTFETSLAKPFCNPMSELSECFPRNGIPHECRSPINAVFKQATDFFYTCRERKVNASLGEVCDVDRSVCQDGTTCIFNFAIEPPLSYCVEPKMEGESCTNPFETVCDVGSCVDGICISVEDGDSTFTENTHVGEGQICQDSLPCAPGTSCREGSCQFPVRIMGKMEECYNLPGVDRTCEEGLVCRNLFGSEGIAMCLDPAEEGEVCTGDEDCKGELKCTTNNQSSIVLDDEICFDPNNISGIGELCRGEGDSPCIESEGERTACLPVEGSELQKCQIGRRLYGDCNPDENVTCIGDTKCMFNVCVPK